MPKVINFYSVAVLSAATLFLYSQEGLYNGGNFGENVGEEIITDCILTTPNGKNRAKTS